MKNIIVKASTVNSEFEFFINPRITGKELFAEISRYVGMRETWFFGLLCVDLEKNSIWIDVSEKKISSLKINNLEVKYCVKYYPEDVENELIEETTIKQFFYKVRSDIHLDKIYCPSDICVLLSSYALQARYGNFNKDIHNNGFLSEESLLPKRVYEQHSISKDEWIDNIVSVWQKHEGMLPEDAVIEYLKEVERLDMFGIHYFNIANRNHSPLFLGISAFGLNIYRNQKIKPEIAFNWSEIKEIHFSDKKFTIQTRNTNPGDTSDFYFFAKNSRINKEIHQLSVGYHELYMRGRKPDPPEVVQMKLLAQRRKLYRKQMSEKLQKEIVIRRNLERKYQDYENNLLDLEAALRNKQSSLIEAQVTIEALQKQLKNLQVVVEQTEKQEQELEEAVKDLEQTQAQRESEIRFLKMELLTKKEMLEIKKEVEDLELHNRDEKSKYTDLQNQLEDLKHSLNQKLIKGNVSDMDQVYQMAIEPKTNKYQTLREIRKIDIKRRVARFETL